MPGGGLGQQCLAPALVMPSVGGQLTAPGQPRAPPFRCRHCGAIAAGGAGAGLSGQKMIPPERPWELQGPVSYSQRIAETCRALNNFLCTAPERRPAERAGRRPETTLTAASGRPSLVLLPVPRRSPRLRGNSARTPGRGRAAQRTAASADAGALAFKPLLSRTFRPDGYRARRGWVMGGGRWPHGTGAPAAVRAGSKSGAVDVIYCFIMIIVPVAARSTRPGGGSRRSVGKVTRRRGRRHRRRASGGCIRTPPAFARPSRGRNLLALGPSSGAGVRPAPWP